MMPSDLSNVDHGTALLALSIAIAAITALVLFFGIVATFIHFRNSSRSSRQDRLWGLWMPQIMNALADSSKPVMGLQVEGRDRLLFLELVARLSLSLGIYERGVLRRLAAPHMSAARQLLRDSDPEFRALGVQLMGLVGGEPERDAIIKAIADPAPLVALAAMRSLTRLGQPRDVERVLAELPRFEKWGPVLLTTILASFGDESRPTIRAVMEDDNRPERQRVAAAGALLKLNDFESADVAERILKGEPGRELAASCLRLIKRLGRPAHALLLRQLSSADDPVVRLHAVSALAALGGPEDVDLVTMAVLDPSHWVAMRATQGLKDMNATGRLRALAARDHPRARLAREYLRREGAYA